MLLQLLMVSRRPRGWLVSAAARSKFRFTCSKKLTWWLAMRMISLRNRIEIEARVLFLERRRRGVIAFLSGSRNPRKQRILSKGSKPDRADRSRDRRRRLPRAAVPPRDRDPPAGEAGRAVPERLRRPRGQPRPAHPGGGDRRGRRLRGELLRHPEPPAGADPRRRGQGGGLPPDRPLGLGRHRLLARPPAAADGSRRHLRGPRRRAPLRGQADPLDAAAPDGA